MGVPSSPEGQASGTPTPSPSASRCAWCGKPIARGADQRADAAGKGRANANGSPASFPDTPVSHGICTTCVVELGVYPVESLFAYAREDYDRLPFGIIEVDAQGRILAYNRWEQELSGAEASKVVGRNFFTEVAPCTGVAEFQGRFDALVAARKPARDAFDFVFRFREGDVMVSIALAWAPVWERGFVLVRHVAG